LVWEWLKKHDLNRYVSKVTAEKPRAVCYIDDKCAKFSGDWASLEEQIKELGVNL
jgi:hypothetical protein